MGINEKQKQPAISAWLKKEKNHDHDAESSCVACLQRVVASLALAVYAGSGAVSAEPEAAQPADRAAAVKAPASTTEPVEGRANGSKEEPHKWWRGNCKRIDTDIRKMDGKIDIALVGDSITARWGGESWKKHWGAYRAVNMGIGGDQTQNVLWRLQNGQLDGYKAKLYILLIGTNNAFDKKVEPPAIADGIKAIIELIKTRQPESRILLMGILPAGEKPNPGREKRAAINDLIAKFADGDVVHYMDIGDKFLEPDGTISQTVMKDFLHLGSKGYDIWAEAIDGKVKELLGDTESVQNL